MTVRRSAFCCCCIPQRGSGTEATIYCNLSSWYVDPAFRNYAPMLTKIAQKNKEVTYINISPATSTWPIIETQGFSSYCSGLFFSIPALSRTKPGMTVETVSPDTSAVEGLAKNDVELLTRHARYGCLSLVCRTAGGEAMPFILLPMRIRRGLDRTAGDAADLLPRHRRLCAMCRRHRPAAAPPRQDFGACWIPTDQCRASPASFPGRAAANISRAPIGPVSAD